MLEYLEKFNKLPPDIKEKISSPEVMKAVSVIENKYHINLATTLMRIMVGDIKILDLKQFFMFEHKLSGPEAETFVEELRKTVLTHVGDFLGIDTGKSEIEMKVGEEYHVPEKKVQSSSFFFSTEDEEEVMKLTEKMGKMSDGNYDETDDKVENIMKKAGVEFASLELAERFKNLIKTYLKGVRNKVDTREALLKSVMNGGLAIDEKLADRIFLIAGDNKLNVVKQAPPLTPELKIEQPRELKSLQAKTLAGVDDLAQVKQEGSAKLEQLINGGGRDMAYDLSAMPKVEQPKEDSEEMHVDGVKTFGSEVEEAKPEINEFVQEPEIKLQDSIIPDIGSPLENSENEPQGPGPISLGSLATVEPVQKIIVQSVTPPKIEAIATPEVSQNIPTEEKKLDEHIAPKKGLFKPRINVMGGGRVKMEDVKHTPRLVGPIDELANLSTVDFRRLDQDPFRAVAKIKNKISVLEEDSFTRRIEGMNAWRESPVHKMYIELGRKSIEEGKSLNDVITETKIEKGDTLNLKEFEAVMDLNKELRF